MPAWVWYRYQSNSGMAGGPPAAGAAAGDQTLHVIVNGVTLFFSGVCGGGSQDAALTRERLAAVLRRRGREPGAQRSRDAGKADLADAPWRPRRRSLDLQARLLRLGGYRASDLPRPSR